MGLAADQGQGHVAICPRGPTRAGEAPSAAPWVCRPWWGWLALPPPLHEGKQLNPFLACDRPPCFVFLCHLGICPTRHSQAPHKTLTACHLLTQVFGRRDTILHTGPGGRKGDLCPHSGPGHGMSHVCPSGCPQSLWRCGHLTKYNPLPHLRALPSSDFSDI